MVRKKIKKAPRVAERAQSMDLNGVVLFWLTELQLLHHKCLPLVAADLDIFSLLQDAPMPQQSPGSAPTLDGAFAQVRGLHALRAAVVRGTVASAEGLRLLFLVSLLVFIDPGCSSLRKAVKGLLLASEKASEALGHTTDDVVELVATRFIDLAWDSAGLLSSARTSPCPAAQKKTATARSMRMVASLQCFVQVPAFERTVLAGKERLLFGRSMEVLGALLDVQAPTLQAWHGRDALSFTIGADGKEHAAVAVEPGPLRQPNSPSRAATCAVSVLEQEDAAGGGVEPADLPTAIDCCSVVLKTAALLLSLTR